MGVGAADEDVGEKEDEAPESDQEDESIGHKAENTISSEDAAKEEQDTKFDGCVCSFFEHQNSVIDLVGIRDGVRFHGFAFEMVVYLALVSDAPLLRRLAVTP